MSQRVGHGTFAYELVDDWMDLPSNVAVGHSAVSTDSADSVYLFNRSEHPVVVLDRGGAFQRSWGQGVLTSAHHSYMGPDDHLYLPVLRRHVVVKCDLEGNVLLTLGTWDEPSNPDWSGDSSQWHFQPPPRAHGPFCLPTDVAVGPDGSIFVSDGYGNARIHRFDAAGHLLGSWGEPGSAGAGQFFTPHAVWVHRDGRVFVADRQNDRIQIFTQDGEHLATWRDVSEPGDIFIDAHEHVWIAEGAGAHRRPGMVQIRSLDGELLDRWGRGSASRGAHDVCVDSRGVVYLNALDDNRILRFEPAG